MKFLLFCNIKKKIAYIYLSRILLIISVLSEEVIASAILEDEDWVVVKTHPKL